MDKIITEIKAIINDIVVEYNKMEDIFDEHFEKQQRTKDDYYTQKEATSLMQELSWIKGKLETIIQNSGKTSREEYILGVVSSISSDDLKNCWSGGMEEYNAIQELLEMYKNKQQNCKEAEDNYMIQKHLINNDFMQDYIKKDIIVDRISKRMKYLMVDSCAEDSGKYTAYRDILNLIEGK